MPPVGAAGMLRPDHPAKSVIRRIAGSCVRAAREHEIDRLLLEQPWHATAVERGCEAQQVDRRADPAAMGIHGFEIKSAVGPGDFLALVRKYTVGFSVVVWG